MAAINDLNKAINLNAKFDKAYFNRAFSYMNMKNFAQAVKDFTSAISINPDDVDYYSGRGNAYYELSNFKLALDDYNKVISLDPNMKEKIKDIMEDCKNKIERI